MKKAEPVIYCDAKGVEHEALVFAVNPFDNSRISLVYVDESKAEADNVVKLIDVRHMDSISESRTVKDSFGNDVQEGNAHLPTYHLNCWKEIDEEHNALPSDHPAYDHPHRKTVDENGKVIPVDRPEYDSHVAYHQAATGTSTPEVDTEPAPHTPPSKPQAAGIDDQVKQNHIENLKAMGEAQEAAKVPDPKDGIIESLRSDNDALAAVVDKLQAELANTTEGRDKALQALADEHAKKQPSQADLDAVAKDQAAADATTGEAPAFE